MDLLLAEKVAKEKILEHCPDFTFKFGKTKNRLGLCSYRKKIIELSKYYVELNPEQSVMDTILHEIAHAKVGCGNGHNRTWKNMAIKLGANPRSTKKAITPKKTVIGECVNCGAKWERYNMPKRSYHHNKCGLEKGKVIWTRI